MERKLPEKQKLDIAKNIENNLFLKVEGRTFLAAKLSKFLMNFF